MDRSESFVAHAARVGCPFMQRRLAIVAYVRLIAPTSSYGTSRQSISCIGLAARRRGVPSVASR